MNLELPASWSTHMSIETEAAYFKKLMKFVSHEYATKTCFPEIADIFAAFDYCSFEATKVVIIGQDPYHGPNQANGLCFSVSDGIKHPPSLVNIFKELKNDCNYGYPESGNLEHWAKQGVLLLNATLTVQENKAGSHQKKGWESFTDAIIKKIAAEKKHVVFLLWGGYAKKKARLINHDQHYVLLAGHPSPLSANRGYWFGNKHFSKTNKLLLENQKEPIVW